MHEQQPAPPRRTRNAAATRTAILEAARGLFGRDSYERVGVRDIAASAGVDPALVIRYFGSKEQLFAEAVTQRFGVGELLAGERSQFGERLARYVLQKERTTGSFDPVLALLRSATNEHAALLLRAGLDNEFIGPLAEWLGGEQPVLRASLITAYLTGLTVMRDVIQSSSLASAEAEALVALVAPVLQSYVDGATV